MTEELPPKPGKPDPDPNIVSQVASQLLGKYNYFPSCVASVAEEALHAWCKQGLTGYELREVGLDFYAGHLNLMRKCGVLERSGSGKLSGDGCYQWRLTDLGLAVLLQLKSQNAGGN